MPSLQTESPAHLAFRSSPIWALRNLDVEETETLVVLRGVVFSYYQKQQALEIIKPHLAGRSLLNCVEVHCPE
jgi:hypothetical protein